MNLKTATKKIKDTVSTVSKYVESLPAKYAEVFPAPQVKPTNDIDNAIVTLSEGEYDRLREIEDQLKALFTLALKSKGVVAFGRVLPDFKEPKIIMRLRELTSMPRYETTMEKEKAPENG